ncbi:hypothetical protein PR202_ga09067 [Eleusine coracana subsp. coracana]|uniref:Poly(A) RNA polymerase mitochondrial-like central palm domain-containing protein n=1 Tax=Eleusine coracana subsp. coracana TaxID=191504 RepID=A0AAV5C260_ELECO|nr:hypothetical protein PR202_ga09067 [Eleusine coracana subsp. coracana]
MMPTHERWLGWGRRRVQPATAFPPFPLALQPHCSGGDESARARTTKAESSKILFHPSWRAPLRPSDSESGTHQHPDATAAYLICHDLVLLIVLVVPPRPSPAPVPPRQSERSARAGQRRRRRHVTDADSPPPNPRAPRSICYSHKANKKTEIPKVQGKPRRSLISAQFASSGVAGYMQFIPHARVPVLQYVSSRFGISCDISIDNNAGQIKSKIFYWVNSLDERFGDMVLLIKEWAKAQNINDPKTGSLNSYSLCLLVLFHFQTSEPPILPPLKDIYEGNITEDTTEMASYNEEQINEVCAANIARIQLQNKGSKNESSLCHLLATFFHKVLNIGIQIFVEDPVERPDNAARAVSMKGLERIVSAFKDAYQKLDSLEHVDRNELLVLLCTPGVSAKLGGRVMANSYRNAPQRSHHQQVRSLGRGGRDQGRVQRFMETRGFTGKQTSSEKSTGE